ncbi:transmembrane protein [Babesia ovis]|uniref:Transmembrane protein n=1 Tax=Babesia ovis TaxID=5869 RepID=A0A9W5T919_BABOV|nr:transmembrane protein [Babesia ovis]
MATIANDNNQQDAVPDAGLGKQNLTNLDFNAQAALILNQHAAIVADMRERDQVKHDKTAHPIAHIKLTSRIEVRIQQVRSDLEILHVIYERITTSKKHRKKYTDEDIKNFEDTLHNLVEQCSMYDGGKYRRQTTAKRRLNVDFSAADGPEEVTEEERMRASESIQRWRKRDQDFDHQLLEIGEAVERIGDVAVVIGEKANEQAKKAIQTMSKVQETTDEISTVSYQIKTLLKRRYNLELGFRIGLIITFLIMFCVFIFALIKFLKS